MTMQSQSGLDQSLGPREARIADGGRRSDPKAPFGVLGRQRRSDRFFNVLHGDQADAMIAVVDHDQFLDAPLMQNPPRLFLAGADRHSRQIVAGHQLADRLARVFGETDVAVGQDTAQLARFLDNRDSADAVRLHQLERVGQGLVGRHGDRVDHHPALEPLDLANRHRLLLDSHVAVKDSDPAELCQSDGHVGLGHRVHRRGHDGDVERDSTRELSAGLGLARQDGGFERLQEHVVERQAKRNVGDVVGSGHIGP